MLKKIFILLLIFNYANSSMKHIVHNISQADFNSDFNKNLQEYFHAIKSNDEIKVKEFLENKIFDVNEIFAKNFDKNCIASCKDFKEQVGCAENWTALHEAIESQRFDIVKLLIENGANVNANFNQTFDFNQKFSFSPLYLAFSKSNYEIVNLLIKNGIDFDQNIELIGTQYRILKYLLSFTNLELKDLDFLNKFTLKYCKACPNGFLEIKFCPKGNHTVFIKDEMQYFYLTRRYLNLYNKYRIIKQLFFQCETNGNKLLLVTLFENNNDNNKTIILDSIKYILTLPLNLDFKQAILFCNEYKIDDSIIMLLKEYDDLKELIGDNTKKAEEQLLIAIEANDSTKVKFILALPLQINIIQAKNNIFSIFDKNLEALKEHPWFGNIDFEVGDNHDSAIEPFSIRMLEILKALENYKPGKSVLNFILKEALIDGNIYTIKFLISLKKLNPEILKYAKFIYNSFLKVDLDSSKNAKKWIYLEKLIYGYYKKINENIYNNPLYTVEDYKYLGTMILNQLKFFDAQGLISKNGIYFSFMHNGQVTDLPEDIKKYIAFLTL